jgi:hypothetical protein
MVDSGSPRNMNHAQLLAFLFSSVKVLYSKEYFRDKSRNHEAENLK